MGVPTKGRRVDHGKSTPMAIGRDMGLTSDVDVDAGNGALRDGGVCAEEE